MGAAAAGAAGAASVGRATKASGVVVRLEPDEFVKILRRVPEPLIVTSIGGIFTTYYEYLMSYKGLAFYTKSKDELPMPEDAELVNARMIWVPD